jgi:iron complex outermembrane receptor protein
VNAWEFGVSQPLGAGWTGYARAGRSFRLAGIDEFNFTSPGVALLPQTSRDYELGARWQHAKARLEARVYRSNLRNEIGFDPNAAGPNPIFPGANSNLDPTRRQGAELDATYAMNAALSLRANLAYREASFRSGAFAGKDVPLVPRRTAALRADWTVRAGHRLSGGVNWVSSQHPDFENTCRMPSYFTADARYSWQFRPQAELAVGVNNLFGRKYFTQAFGCDGAQATSVFPEPGRQLTASVRLQF